MKNLIKKKSEIRLFLTVGNCVKVFLYKMSLLPVLRMKKFKKLVSEIKSVLSVK